MPEMIPSPVTDCWRFSDIIPVTIGGDDQGDKAGRLAEGRSIDRMGGHTVRPLLAEEKAMSERDVRKTDLVFTVSWEAKPSEIDALTEIVRRFLPLAEREPGLRVVRTHQSVTDPAKFFFYEIFEDEAAFAAHQQTEHYKTLIMEQAVPKLAKRERIQHRVV
ncbi:MAG TPA: antibiotic biosynthesis monooxygenase family protein [Reyranella sp.]|nr:antibiotic biosynthesis monooxygenase family protein [Reyranella sp.]